MSSVDFTKYRTVDEIIEDIKAIRIQGATNVAIATFEGLKLHLDAHDDVSKRVANDGEYKKFLDDVEAVGYRLANARPNEPLAKNGVKYIFYKQHTESKERSDLKEVARSLIRYCNEYLDMIEASKSLTVEHSKSVTAGIKSVLTHCHSSTAERVIISQAQNIDGFKAVCCETRPLYQGRITAKNLVDAGVDTTLVVDSAVESFIVGHATHKIEMVFLGCDQITHKGDLINKIGSWGASLSAYYANIPVYIVTSILKVDLSSIYKPIEIEMRESKEIWEDAPAGLKLINPAFEIVNHQFVTGFITEAGVIKPDQIEAVIRDRYGWLY